MRPVGPDVLDLAILGLLFEQEMHGYETVSYTHLTLPTIYSV